MAPSSKDLDPTADPFLLIQSSIKGSLRQQLFIDRLGLPQLPEHRGRKGAPQFDGPAGKECSDLYRDMSKRVDEIDEHFLFKDYLRNAAMDEHLELAEEFAKPLISAYGKTIWGTTEPYVTRIHERHYPQRLKYGSGEDCERIILHLYCWMISRVIKKLPPRKGCDGSHAEGGETGVEWDDYHENNAQPTSVSAVPANSTQATSSFAAPVANMVPAHRVRQTRAHEESESRIDAPSEEEDGVDSDDGTSQPKVDRGPMVKRRGCSWRRSSPAKCHKRRAHSNQSADIQGLRKRTRDVPGDDTDGPYPSPPAGLAPSSQLQKRSQNNGMVDEGVEGGDVADGVDSGVGSSDTQRPSPQASSAGPGSRSRLLIPIKTGPRSQELDNIRMCLASKILDILRIGLDRPNTILLLNAVDLLSKIWEKDCSRLFRVYGSRLNDIRGVKYRWTQCIEAIANFCQLAQLGSERSVAEILKIVDQDFSDAAMQCYHHTRGVIATWRFEEDWCDEEFGRQVASVLFHSASWHPRWMSLEKMEVESREFNRKLLSWCTQI